jgi:MYXO-CTERM domain-containing protein
MAHRIGLMAGALAAAATLGAGGAHARELLKNPGFETGDFTGWDVNQQLDSSGGLFVVANNGGSTPVSGMPYDFNASGGSFFAVSDGDPGSYVLSQFFRVGLHNGPPVISFQLFANNWGGAVAANGRDLHTIPNQNVEVDVLTQQADPLTNDPGDIVATLYGPGADPGLNPHQWSDYSFTLNLAPGQYQLRFAETNNTGPLNMGVDNASVSVTPEPASWAMMLAGVGLVGLAARRRAARAA